MHGSTDGPDDEVVHERAITSDRLRTHAGRCGHEVGPLEFGYESLRRRRKASPTQRTRHLAETEPPVVASEAPEAGESQRRSQLANVYPTPLVTLTSEREHRVGTDVDRPVDTTRQVYAEERVRRIGDRVDERPHELGTS